jgi:exodeoxyribonuclease III
MLRRVKLATWNVNSVRAREERLLAFLERQQPDVVCLQELKVSEAEFPLDALERAGYRAAVFGQRTYNGVAILSRAELDEVERGLGEAIDDGQARLIRARTLGVRVLCAYFPNGQVVGSPKYEYKLAWMRALGEHLRRHHDPAEPLALCGDFNVAPDERDVDRPDEWKDSVLCHADARAALEEIRAWGLLDVFRRHHQEGGLYTWWDYRMLGFPKNNGLRIDHVWATPPLARRSTAAEVDRDERKGKRPSDHAPLIATFEG